MTTEPTLSTPVHPALGLGACFQIEKEDGGIFYWTITNGWQGRHASPLEAARWQFPRARIVRVSPFQAFRPGRA